MLDFADCEETKQAISLIVNGVNTMWYVKIGEYLPGENRFIEFEFRFMDSYKDACEYATIHMRWDRYNAVDIMQARIFGDKSTKTTVYTRKFDGGYLPKIERSFIELKGV